MSKLIGFCVTLGAGILIGMHIYQKETETELKAKVEDAFEKGMQTGFQTAPGIYREMVKNGDIEKVPEGMNVGEVGKVFRTLEEAKLARLQHQMKTGRRNVEDIYGINENDKCCELYFLIDREKARKG